jgi:hypothetical protein
MKIEFDLTFEDYLEWRSPDPSRKQSNAGIILACAGFLSLALGYAILRSSPESNSFFPGGTFLIGGLLTTFVAVPVGLLAARRKPEKTRAELLSEFECFYVERRSLEADDTGWAFMYGTGVNKRQWADLAYMREAQRTFILSDAFAWYVLPKSAFSEEQVQEFKKLCEQALIPADKLLSVSMVTAGADYVRALITHNWRKMRGTVLGLYVLGLVSVFFIALIFADTSFFLGIFAVPIFALLLITAQQLHYRKTFDRDYVLRSFQNADILKDAICFRATTELSVVTTSEIKKIKYRWITDIQETKRSFMLYVAPKLFYIVPKAEFTSDQVEQFRELLRTRRQEHVSMV